MSRAKKASRPRERTARAIDAAAPGAWYAPRFEESRIVGVGAVVPGMPTTVFVLLGSYFLVRSCPWLEERLLTSRLFRPYAQFVRSREPMSTKARIAAISAMSLSVVVSLALLAAADKLTPVIAGGVIALWLAGFIAIMLFRRRRA
jgi:uncharacterized membrane protein YbaN (DUF454 family)